MKRHPALEPFSRDHNGGLILARALIECRPGAAEEFRKAWDRELADHFDEEERLLGVLAGPSLAERLASEHRHLRGLVAGLPGSGKELGHALDAHIRWEERELFVAIEAGAGEAQLAELAARTQAVEERRWPHSPQRAELVKRRRAARNPG